MLLLITSQLYRNFFFILYLQCFQVSYSDLAAVIQRKESMEFLHDIVPKKIKYSEYLKLVEDSKDEEEDLF